eukprot:gene12925-525_t
MAHPAKIRFETRSTLFFEAKINPQRRSNSLLGEVRPNSRSRLAPLPRVNLPVSAPSAMQSGTLSGSSTPRLDRPSSADENHRKDRPEVKPLSSSLFQSPDKQFGTPPHEPHNFVITPCSSTSSVCPNCSEMRRDAAKIFPSLYYHLLPILK